MNRMSVSVWSKNACRILFIRVAVCNSSRHFSVHNNWLFGETSSFLLHSIIHFIGPMIACRFLLFPFAITYIIVCIFHTHTYFKFQNIIQCNFDLLTSKRTTNRSKNQKQAHIAIRFQRARPIINGKRF